MMHDGFMYLEAGYRARTMVGFPVAVAEAARESETVRLLDV